MIARFFIDRPIFAAVLSVVVTLVGGIALAFLPIAQYPRITPPGVNISISYPGASAQVVADTVGAPVEQQVNGVEGMLYMSSNSGNDGTYSLSVTFDIGTDLNKAVVQVQNRVALAMPQLPTEVQNQGITIRKKTPDILMIVDFTSSDPNYDNVYLSNYATIYVRDELLRVPGVSDITYQGERDFSIRCWLDPQKMAACGVTPGDVAAAIRNQNLDAPAGWIGQPPIHAGQAFELPIDTLGRLNQPQQFADIVIKADLAAPPASNSTAVAPPQANLGLPGAGNPSSGSASGSGDGSGGTGGTTVSTTASVAGTSTSDTTAGSSASTGGPSTSGGGGTTGGAATSSGGANSGGGANTGGAASGTSGAVVGASLAVTPDLTPQNPAAAIVRMRDIARVEMAALNYTQACSFDGKPAVGLSVYQQPDTNALEVAKAVRKKMEELKTRFPEGVHYDIGYDTTPYISESIRDVCYTMLEAIVLVGVVVLLFLQDWRAMILPMLDVPVSIIGTFAVMAAMNFSLNNISLFGLVLAIGIVVDDAIVVLENIERMLARGYDVRTATIKAMDEVTGPIVAVALVLCAVFVPCAFLSGITGQFFRQFALTISVSTVISALNAITMTPSRAVLLFKAGERVGAGVPASAGKEPAESGTQAPAHEIRHEALPWWFFGVVGGLLTVWMERKFLAGNFGLPSLDADLDWWTWGIIIVASFLPGALVGGAIGRLIIGYVNPALGWSFQRFNRYFDRLSSAYASGVGGLLRVSIVVLLVYGGLLALTGMVFSRAPTGFIPTQDQGRLIANIQLPDSASLERTQKVVAEIEKIALGDPKDPQHYPGTHGIAHIVSFSGMSFLLQASSSNFASMFIVLDSFDKRQDPQLADTQIMKRLSEACAARVPEAQFTVLGASAIPGIGTAGGFKFVVEDRGGLGVDALQTQSEGLITKLQKLPGLTHVTTQFRARTPQIFLDIDREKAAMLGVSLADVNQTLDILMGSSYVNSFNAFGRHWQVTVQADENYRDRVEKIKLYQVRNALGQMVMLGTLVHPHDIAGPISVPRYNLYSGASVSGNIETGTSTGEAIKTIESIAGDSLPLSMRADWTELMFLQKRVGDTSIYVFFLAILCVFLALSALYESWALPLAVILVVPLCLLCSAAGVLLTHRDVNIFVQIGLVVLVGLACKNAILVVEYAKQLHLEGRTAFEATREASRLRLRPILMTSLAFIFGVMPLTIASGAGAEMRRSLGVAVFCGMFGVTLFGIFLTPVFFYVIIGLGESRWIASERSQRIIASAFGGAAGAAGGYLLGALGVVLLPWSALVGGAAGVLAVVGVMEVHRRIRGKDEG
jgi:multidrug efflux pump